MPRIPRSRIEDAESSYIPLERLKQRAKRSQVKMAKATEHLVEDLAEREGRLSEQVLMLHKLLRATYRILTPAQKAEFEAIKAEIGAEVE